MLPYFKTLLDHLDAGETTAREAFGRHVHWGFWEEPPTAPVTPREFHDAAEAMLRRVLGTADLRAGMTVLDVGCGLGGTIEFLNAELAACTLVGLNIDDRQLAVARRSVAAANRNMVAFVGANACQLPFAAGSFDTVLCVESIFHFPSRRALFRECGRILRPGGVLVVSDFVPVGAFGTILDRAERATGLVGRMYGQIHSDISVSRYRKLAQATDLECVAIDDITRNTLPTYRFLRSNLHVTKERAVYARATGLVEVLSRTRLLRYLVLTFRKP